MLSTTHPHVLYGVAAAEVLVFLALGLALMSKSVAGGCAVAAIGLVAALLPAVAAHWSERHPDLARQQVATQQSARNNLARRHPTYFLVVLPIIAAVDASLRWNRDQHHHSAAGWLIPAGIGLVLGLGIGAVLVYRARHARTAYGQ